MIFKLFVTCLIPRLNWAIAITEGDEDIKNIYIRIDQIIITIIKSICLPDINSVEEGRRRFVQPKDWDVENIDAEYRFNQYLADKLCATKENGGLQLLLPGYFYDAAQEKLKAG